VPLAGSRFGQRLLYLYHPGHPTEPAAHSDRDSHTNRPATVTPRRRGPPPPTRTSTAIPCPQWTPTPTHAGSEGSFNPTSSACFTTATNPDAATCDGNSAPSAKSNILTTFELPLGDVNFDALISFTPSAFTVPAAVDLPIGAIVGRLNAMPALRLINGPCASLLPANFTFMNASVDVDTTETIDPLPFTTTNNLAQDGNSNGLPEDVEKYPASLNNNFKNQQPRASYSAATYLPFASGLWVILQFVIFEPRTSPNPDVLPPLDPVHGYPSVAVLQDPTQPPAVSAITDFCSSLKVRAVFNGETEECQHAPE